MTSVGSPVGETQTGSGQTENENLSDLPVLSDKMTIEKKRGKEAGGGLAGPRGGCRGVGTVPRHKISKDGFVGFASFFCVPTVPLSTNFYTTVSPPGLFHAPQLVLASRSHPFVKVRSVRVLNTCENFGEKRQV